VNKGEKTTMDVRTYLEQQQVHPQLIRAVEEFRNQYPVEEKVKYRVSDPMMPFYGTEILEMGIAALLQKENLLLSGSKATGKNVLAENLAWIFQRPTYNISFHVNTGSGDLIGTDTFEDNQVKLRKGSIYQCAEYGGFGILDEINMARNEALAVLHSVLDFRRVIDVPGYDRIEVADDTRFIATMNYNYAGTRELNEALASRFVVIQMPPLAKEDLERLLKDQFPSLVTKYNKQFALLFNELQKKCENGELTEKALDLRGLIDAVSLIKKGIPIRDALDLGITNKIFDSYEKELIRDVIASRFPLKLHNTEVFE